MMTGDSVAQISKPLMRGLHNATIKRNLIVAGGLCLVICTTMKLLLEVMKLVYNDPKKADYAEFYK
jgi:cytochrome c oxidase subunit 6c